MALDCASRFVFAAELLLLLLVAFALCDVLSPFPPIVPFPTNFTNGTDVAVFDAANVTLVVDGAAAQVLQRSFDRFLSRTIVHVAAACAGRCLSRIHIQVADPVAELQLGVDESYSLLITGEAVEITSGTVFGAYHALESLSQLVFFDPDAEEYVIRNVPWKITDAPRFQHRGLLLDSSRHFLPVTTMRAVIDSMTYAKLNALHWHMVDAESFPFNAPSFPQFGRLASYSPVERYTVSDVRGIVDYARDRGIRVVVELDVPGHTAAMCKAVAEMCPSPLCSNWYSQWALDPTRNRTYEVIRGLLRDFASVFPERMVHLGGDEVNYQCWEEHPYIMQWLKDHNFTLTEGYMHFVQRAQQMAWELHKEAVGWQEVWTHFGTNLDPRTIIQQWRFGTGERIAKEVTSHGYRLIWSDSSVWYLDSFLTPWWLMYTAEPCTGLNATECDRVLGGEACQWGEVVDTSDIMPTIWPRAAAVAERLWSPRHVNSAAEADDRMTHFRCLLNQRGVAAAPIKNLVARSPPPNPGSCYEQ